MKQRKCYDSTAAAIRVIVSFITEQLHHLGRVRSVDRLTFYESMLAEVVGLAKASLNTVQFACIFLSIARQLEHYHLKHLFPLPLRSDSDMQYITVEDLFIRAVKKKSLPVASSSLPIFESTESLHDYCLDLLHHCVTVVLDFLAVNDCADMWSIREEFVFLRQIFNYTVKLEDSVDARQYHYADVTQLFDEDSAEGDNLTNEIDHSYFSDVESYEDSEILYSFESEYTEELDFEAVKPSRMKRIANAFTPAFLRRSNSVHNDNEKAIAEAASAFVRSGFHDTSVMSNSVNSSRYEVTGTSSVGSAILDDSIFFDAPSKGNVSELIAKAIASCLSCNHLNHIAVLCTLLHSQSNDLDYEINAALDRIQHITERHYLKMFKVLYDENVMDCVTILSNLLENCTNSWSKEDAEAVLNVMLIILARFKDDSDDNPLLSIVTMVILISCHISCHTSLLMSDSRIVDSEIGRMFKKVTQM